MAERQFGPYRLVRQIAVGGMAEIHLAKTKGIAGFEKYVALKMIHPNFAQDEQFIQMLVDEAKIAVQLNHGNIAQTFDLGRVGDTFYITMEYVDGADLYKILRRGSEVDFELPLDVCAFVAKEVASALDHAHRKRDHTGKNLGIVHRDVSPQNVLISYSGEIKLVDFGIAKATMKVRQTAVGVIKGKYYYMSPEQAYGEPIDSRSDIFSAGIVLYEMMTGQMLYLEEDLHKLLDMVRKADIAPPSTLRKGVPPQLERIVMHALEADRRHRYQSASDFATDLERFLHTYSPVFTAGKVAALIRQVIGDPQQVPSDGIELRDGPTATHTLTSDDLILDKDELRDANSVIFSIEELREKDAARGSAELPTAPQRKRVGTPEGRVTRQADIQDLSQSRPLPRKPPTPAVGSPAAARVASKPRSAHEDTRQVPTIAPPPLIEDSGLLELKTPPSAIPAGWGDARPESEPTVAEPSDLDSIGERTMITGAPRGFMIDIAGEEGADATVVSAGPPLPPDDEDDEHETLPSVRPDTDDDGQTAQRDFREPAPAKGARRGPPPPALAANIHAPAVSEIRKPRASRKTPHGMPAGNVLQAIVGAQPGEAMPSPRLPSPSPVPPPSDAARNDDSGMATIPQQPSPVAHRSAPPPPDYQPYAYAPPQPISPQAMYQPPPYFGPPPAPRTLTGQLRLIEADEIPDKYKVSAEHAKWIKLVIAGALAVSVAAGVTFFIIKATRDTTPTVGTLRIASVPPGAEVFFDGTRLAGTTPLSVPGNVPTGTRHEVRIEKARYQPYVEMVDIPRTGGDVAVTAMLTPLTGTLRVVTQPDGAEIWIDGQLRGTAPRTIEGLDLASSQRLELRLRDFQSHAQDLVWPDNGRIDVNHTLAR